jgi:hypothetical protein
MTYPELNGLKITEIQFPDITPGASSKMLPCEFFVVLNEFILLSGTLVQYPARINIAFPSDCKPGNWIPTGPNLLDPRSIDWLREAVISAWKELPYPEIPPI